MAEATSTVTRRQPRARRRAPRMRLTSRLAFVSSLIVAVSLGTVAYYMYLGVVDTLIEDEITLLTATNEAAAARLSAGIDSAAGDTVYLANTPPITGIVRARENNGIDPEDGSTLELWEARLTTLFANLIASEPSYLQARYIGLDGQEILRVDRTATGEITRIPESDLQNKSGRPYFSASIGLPAGGVYISDADLNREFGVIQEPFVPVVRTATPAFDETGRLLGIVVVNIAAEDIFDVVSETVREGATHFVTNETGDYLFHPTADVAFGFETGDRYQVQTDIPALEPMVAADAPERVASFSGIVPLSTGDYVTVAQAIHFDAQRPERYFLLVSLWPRSEVAAQIDNVRSNTIFVSLVLILLGSGAMIVAARVLTRPLLEMTKAAGQVAAGEQPPEMPMLVARRDETGDLARAVDSMLVTVANRESEIAAQTVELKRSNQALRDSEKRLEGFLRAVPDAMLVVDNRGNILFANEQVRDVFGYEPSELNGEPIERLVPDQFKKAHLGHIHSYYREPKARQMGAGKELQALRKDGSTIPVEVSLAPAFEGEGQATVAAIREISDRKRMEQQLHRAQKMEAVGTLSGGVAHDFNNLLGVVIGNLDLAADDPASSDETRLLIREALDAALHGSDLTKRMLAFARRQPLHPALIEVNDAIDNLVKIVSRTLPAEIAIVTEFADDLPRVNVDTAQLETSVLNIVNNARDAMPDGGSLTIATSKQHLEADFIAADWECPPGDYVLLEVTDTGIGISADALNKIFEPFYTSKEFGAGTGLGLSMVFGFVKQSGGYINVYSEVGVGTTFRIYLPLADEGLAASDKTVEPEAPDPGGTETVLAVEDNEGLSRIVAKQIEGLGYSLREARNAADALRVLETEDIDLVFSDIVMPGGMNGFELAEEIGRRWPSVKVVLTSGFPNARKSDASSASIDIPLLIKPYRRSELAHALRNALDDR